MTFDIHIWHAGSTWHFSQVQRSRFTVTGSKMLAKCSVWPPVKAVWSSGWLPFRNAKSSLLLHRKMNCVHLVALHCVYVSSYLMLCTVCPPFPQIDIIGAVVIVWRVTGKTIRSVLCNIVCNNCAQCDAHTYEQTNSSLDWVLSHWAHFTVLRFIFACIMCISVYCVHV